MTSYSFISQSQLDTIRQKVLESPIDNKLETRRTLKQQSDERAEKWPNTLRAQRARKERGRQEKLAAEEAERSEMDRVTAEAKTEQRRLQIEKANKVLWDETDGVKAVHSKILLCDIIKENELLIEQKKMVQGLKRAQEQAFVEQQRQALEAADEVELKKLYLAKERALQQKDVQLAQLEEMKVRIIAERKANLREGEILKKKALEEAEELNIKEEQARERCRVLNQDSAQANKVLQLLREKEAERSRQAEEAIEEYAAKKTALQEERKRREAERTAAKEAEKQKLVETMERIYLAAVADTDARTAKEVKAAEEKSQAVEEERRRKREAEAQAIDASRQEQLARKAEAKLKEGWSEKLASLKQEQTAEEVARRQQARQLAEFQKRQANIQARKLAAAKVEKLQEAALVQMAVQEQEETLEAYTEACIQDYQVQGMPVKPLTLHSTKQHRNRMS